MTMPIADRPSGVDAPIDRDAAAQSPAQASVFQVGTEVIVYTGVGSPPTRLAVVRSVFKNGNFTLADLGPQQYRSWPGDDYAVATGNGWFKPRVRIATETRRAELALVTARNKLHERLERIRIDTLTIEQVQALAAALPPEIKP